MNIFHESHAEMDYRAPKPKRRPRLSATAWLWLLIVYDLAVLVGVIWVAHALAGRLA